MYGIVDLELYHRLDENSDFYCRYRDVIESDYMMECRHWFPYPRHTLRNKFHSKMTLAAATEIA